MTAEEMAAQIAALQSELAGLKADNAAKVGALEGTVANLAHENAILRRIIPDCIEDTGGLFVVTPDDDPAYGDEEPF